ncbi:unnamed protein product [Pseudo-nitzschia multistriata]|uniref:Disease resistance R13L4/SHOC-2-like LRR domain-containing protein n=1 Tax=Pseudo-nitzschia multistriata TaxID=183589 RepID=A0A448ZHZ7_9STRA|nr:unnamed protein product [Pseudo-nitzschia multistriata]
MERNSTSYTMQATNQNTGRVEHCPSPRSSEIQGTANADRCHDDDAVAAEMRISSSDDEASFGEKSEEKMDLSSRATLNKGSERKTFPKDCYSFLSLHSFVDSPLFFSFGFTVFLFQVSFFVLMVLSVLDPVWSSNGDKDNPSDSILATFVDANSTPLVRATQVISILTYVVFADSSMMDVAIGVETFPRDLKEATNSMVFSCVLRISQGFMAAMTAFVLIITAENVIDIVLNFTAVNFISHLDDVAFQLAVLGKYGERLEQEANRIKQIPLPPCMSQGKTHTRFRSTLATCGVLFLGTMIAIMCAQDNDDVWLTKVLRIEFQDPELHPYSGCYEIDATSIHDTFKRKVYRSSDDSLDDVNFGYCIDSRQWKLFENVGDPCDANENTLAVSAKTDSFDISTVFGEAWFSLYGKPLDVYFYELDEKLEGNCSSFDDGKCDSLFNKFEYQFDGGDCCSATCSHFDCGIGAIKKGFGMENAIGDGFPQCSDPNMVPLTIRIGNFSSSGLAQVPEEWDIDNSENPLDGHNNPVSPHLSLECDQKNVFAIDLDPSMTDRTEIVSVTDGAKCTMKVSNRTVHNDTDNVLNREPIWFVDYAMFQGETVENGTKILEHNSGVQEESSFFVIPKCMFKKLSLYTDETELYNDGASIEAFEWIREGFFGTQACDDDNDLICLFALSSLYFAAPLVGIDDEAWIKETPHCNWGAVECTRGDISKLKLEKSSLAGTISSAIGLLTSLREFNMKSNKIIGKIPIEIGLLTFLQKLDLKSNEIEGEIPSEIGLLMSLQALDLSYNRLTGRIPTEILSLPSLEVLHLDSNALSGEIPSEIGLLTSLESLWLGHNGFTGEIPTEIGSLTSLQGLWFELDNGFTGDIPSEIGLLSSLQQLWLELINGFGGEIPSEIGLLTSLQTLWLELDKDVTGAIPTEIGLLTSLRVLHMELNDFTGEIPSEIGLLTSLEEINLTSNNSTAAIPCEIASLLDNNTTGGIPSE